MNSIKIFATILLVLVLALCGWTLLNRNDYPAQNVKEMSARLKRVSQTIRNIHSDSDFELKWPELRIEIEEVDQALQHLLQFAQSQPKEDAKLSDEDYEAVSSARDEFFDAFSQLENKVSREKSKMAKSIIRTELDMSTSGWSQLGNSMAEFTKANKLYLSIFAGILIWIIGRSSSPKEKQVASD